jgi:Protein of unknown function (DUF429)
MAWRGHLCSGLGIDGIRGGWITARLSAAGGAVKLHRIDSLDRLVQRSDAATPQVVVIDIPLGLMQNTPRRADEEACAFWGARVPASSRVPITGCWLLLVYPREKLKSKLGAFAESWTEAPRAAPYRRQQFFQRLPRLRR